MFKTSRNRNSVKIVLDFTGVLRLLGNNSVIPLLTAAKKRHFYPPKLPALRAEVDGRTQKSVRPFSCFSSMQAPYPSPRRKRQVSSIPLHLLFRPNPLRWASVEFLCRTSAQRPVFWCLAGTRSTVPQKPHKPPTRVRRRGNLCLQRRRFCAAVNKEQEEITGDTLPASSRPYRPDAIPLCRCCASGRADRAATPCADTRFLFRAARFAAQRVHDWQNSA